MDKNLRIEQQVLKALLPMGEVNLVGDKIQGVKYITKNEKTFGIIKNGTVYLLNKEGRIYPVDNISGDSDEFLELATKAYWIVSGKI